MTVNKRLVYFLLLFVLLSFFCPGCTNESGMANDTGQLIRSAAGPYLLDIPLWQLQNIFRWYGNNDNSQDSIGQVLLRSQIIDVLEEEEFAVIPDVRFRLESPPDLLVISPRDRIEYLDRVLVKPGMNVGKMEEIESGLEALGFSALVVRLGGIGVAYPSIVSPEMGTNNIIKAVIEEWAHQFLAMKPLGFLYLLDCIGFKQDAEVIEMNETLAGIMTDEIGQRVIEKYYPSEVASIEKTDGSRFDFDKEMNETRRNVDIMLQAGEIDVAEQYMQERRNYFERNGYNIRRLNQAYFAFHGIYGKDPGAVSTIYDDMMSLRSSYKTLYGFVNDVSLMTGYARLHEELSARQ